jgi:hypothetical protein
MSAREARPPFFTVHTQGGAIAGFACNAGAKGWLPCNRDGEAIGLPLPLQQCVETIRAAARHGAQDGD